MSRRRRPRPARGRAAVSVVIPCYNYGHYLAASVGSVLDQPDVNVEVLLIDDASPDGSAAEVRAWAERDSRVTAILHRENRGHIATYNEGLERVTGDYVVLLSADDALAPGSLRRATALMESEPSVGLVYGFPVEFEHEVPPQVSTRATSWTVWPGLEWIEGRARRGRNCIMCPEVVLRTSVQRQIGGYDPRLPHSGDLEMWLRAAAVGDIGRVNGAVQAFYRVHPKSMQRTTFGGHLHDLEGRLAAFEAVLLRGSAPVPRGEEMAAKARRALARSAVHYARQAYDHGRAGSEPIDEYLAFARRAWPEVEATAEWRRLGPDRRAGRPPGWPIGPFLRRRGDDLGSRMRWRRWRSTGV